MNKTLQRMILIVAVVLCGLTYFLQTWKKPDVKRPIDTTLRTMRLDVAEKDFAAILRESQKHWLLSIQFTTDTDIAASRLHNTVMGGLGVVQNQVLAMQVVLHNDSKEWRQSAHPDYPNILQLFPSAKDIPTLLQKLRICWYDVGDCKSKTMQHRGSDYLYLLEPQELTVRYFGDQRWGALALVHDIQQALGAWD